MAMPGNYPYTRVFVYGSLLERKRQRELTGRELRMLPAMLPGFERRRARYFHIVPNPAAETKGAILMDLNSRDLAALDRYEGLPDLYTREIVTAHTAANGRITCWCYMPAAGLDTRLASGPTAIS
jgi:gamma-glutamylcyclotransferase (GGCT)/AIG2-like uncharacterized protein YtfP